MSNLTTMFIGIIAAALGFLSYKCGWLKGYGEMSEKQYRDEINELKRLNEEQNQENIRLRQEIDKYTR